MAVVPFLKRCRQLWESSRAGRVLFDLPAPFFTAGPLFTIQGTPEHLMQSFHVISRTSSRLPLTLPQTTRPYMVRCLASQARSWHAKFWCWDFRSLLEAWALVYVDRLPLVDSARTQNKVDWGTCHRENARDVPLFSSSCGSGASSGRTFRACLVPLFASHLRAPFDLLHTMLD